MPEELLLKMLGLLESKNTDLVSAVSFSLSTIQDSRIRKVGLEWLNLGYVKGGNKPILLLKNSVMQKDTLAVSQYFDSVFSSVATLDSDCCHDIVLEFLRLIDLIEMDIHLQRILEICYAWTPCSLCRDEVYENLLKMGEDKVNPEIIREHRCDSFE